MMLREKMVFAKSYSTHDHMERGETRASVAGASRMIDCWLPADAAAGDVAILTSSRWRVGWDLWEAL
jgi:hypothetical protein